jgi:hypothetical protein
MSSREIMDSMSGTNTRTMSFRDPVVENVCDKFLRRSDVGYEKYGRTLDTERRGKHKDLLGYLNDVQEELMDAVLYIQAAREEMMEQMQRIDNTTYKNSYDNTPEN